MDVDFILACITFVMLLGIMVYAIYLDEQRKIRGRARAARLLDYLNDDEK